MLCNDIYLNEEIGHTEVCKGAENDDNCISASVAIVTQLDIS